MDFVAVSDKPWKRVEREKCRELGGERSGPTGTDTPDCFGVRVGLEIKYVKKYTFLTTYWEQAVENAAKAGLPPVLAVKEAKRGGRDCAQMFTRDYFALMKQAGRAEPLLFYTPDDTIRMSWGYFVRLYRAAYIPAYQDN
jgi:hypothetical protein